MSKYSENMPPNLLGAVEWMIDSIDPGSVLLDIGCSTGYFGKYLKDTKNCIVYGIEISEDIKEAKKVLDGVYSFDLDGEWPKEIYERKYDYLFFGDVIEHLKDPQKVLEKSKKLLKPGGKIFISTPNVAHISIRLELMGGNFEYEPMGILDSTHLKYFTKNSLINLIQKAGYELKSMDFTANDYPDDTIKLILNKVGLTPNDKFWKMVNEPEARAFQYKLIIEPTSKNNSRLVEENVILNQSQKPEIIRNAEMNDLKQKVIKLQKHASDQAKIIEHINTSNDNLTRENKDLEKTLERLHSTLPYKIMRNLKRSTSIRKK